MKINVGKHDCTELWDKVIYKALSNYPNVTPNEIKDIIDLSTTRKNMGVA